MSNCMFCDEYDPESCLCLKSRLEAVEAAECLERLIVELWELNAAAALEGVTAAGRIAKALGRISHEARQEIASVVARGDA
jgi:hypothetical protein